MFCDSSFCETSFCEEFVLISSNGEIISFSQEVDQEITFQLEIETNYEFSELEIETNYQFSQLEVETNHEFSQLEAETNYEFNLNQ